MIGSLLHNKRMYGVNPISELNWIAYNWIGLTIMSVVSEWRNVSYSAIGWHPANPMNEETFEMNFQCVYHCIFNDLLLLMNHAKHKSKNTRHLAKDAIWPPPIIRNQLQISERLTIYSVFNTPFQMKRLNESLHYKKYLNLECRLKCYTNTIYLR